MITQRPAPKVLCLRPRNDFQQVGVEPPVDLDIEFVDDESRVTTIPSDVACVVLPSAGAALSPSLFDNALSLRLVQYTGAGVDRVAAETIERIGCAVCNVPGASAPDVAAYVVLASGALLRRIALGNALVQAGRYADARNELTPSRVRGFRGLRVGVVGLGSIGSEVARVLDSLGADLAWSDVVDPSPCQAVHYERMELPELLARTELLTLHVPLTPATKGLISREEIARLPAGAVIVNAARGSVVDEDALVEALDSGHLGGCALDVYAKEPLPADAPLLMAAHRHGERMLLTPHVAGVTPEASRELFSRAWGNVHAVLQQGLRPAHQVA